MVGVSEVTLDAYLILKAARSSMAVAAAGKGIYHTRNLSNGWLMSGQWEGEEIRENKDESFLPV
jgi:hypothetical protein